MQADYSRQDKRVTVIGFITAGFLMASVIAQLFGVVIEASLGWQAIFICHGNPLFGNGHTRYFLFTKRSCSASR